MKISRQNIIQAAKAACMVLFLTPAIVQAQPDTLWVRAIDNGSRPMEVIRTSDGAFAIGGAGWCGDEDRRDVDFSIIKTDSVAFFEWRKFYKLISDTLRQNDQSAYAIEQLPDDGYVLSGLGHQGGMIVRTDSTGEMLWSRFYDIPNWFYDSAIADDGNIVAVSVTDAARKIDMEEGDIVWQRRYTEESGGRFWNITNTADGGFLLTGEISSIGEGSADMYAVKIDRDGEMEWYNTYGTEYFEVIGHAVQTADGGYCMVGGSHDGHLNNYGMIVRTDENGEEIWRNIFADEDGNIIMSYLLAVVETPDGGFAVAREGFRNFTRLGRLDSEGELLWSKEYIIPDAIHPNPFSLFLMEDFGYLQGGFASGVGDWLIRTEPDSLSVIAWDLQADADNLAFEDVPIDSTAVVELTLTNEAEYPVYIHNITTDSAVFSVEFEDVLALEGDEEVSIPVMFTPTDSIAYSGVLTVHTKFRNLMVKLSGTGVWLSVLDNENLQLEYTLSPAYPNPFNSRISIQYEVPEWSSVSLTIYDLSGREVAVLHEGNIEAGVHSVTWDASSMAAGMYICSLKDGCSDHSTKIVLVK